MSRFLFTCIVFLLTSLGMSAQQAFDNLCAKLRGAPVQEKVYLHLDNNCYFKGDTIWYKAYTVRADDFTPSDMSRILYVELVSPDGLVVERQQVVSGGNGYSCGNFHLTDSLYSGYFEIRAYTRWMLNFNVTQHPFFRKDLDIFYNRQMMLDFYRLYGSVYSRVVPVYEKPEQAGAYDSKYIVSRPKQRLPKELKEQLRMNFYPEGGHLIAGTRCRVAFETIDEEGEAVTVSGEVNKVPVRSVHMGRGSFEVEVPEKGKLEAQVTYHGRKLKFDLPKREESGCALRLDNDGQQLKAHVELKNLPMSDSYVAVILCRGVLSAYTVFTPGPDGSKELEWGAAQLPTGVNDLVIMDAEGTPLADRLFFVNNHDYDAASIEVTGDALDYEPFSLISLDFHAPKDAGHISISVRDQSTDDPTFDTGNILTDLLLSSELRGFIPYPDYYFESDDAEHRHALDLLMMVQGWRRYNIKDLQSDRELRYAPEKSMTVEGSVYPIVYFDTRDYSENESWSDDFYNYSPSDPANEASSSSSGDIQSTQLDGSADNRYAEGEIAGNQHGGLKKEVKVESELVIDSDVYGVEVETNNGGRFSFNIPPFYGKGILTMTAYDLNDSEKDVNKMKVKGRLDEDEFPNFYVKRNLFYPVFADKYSFYQCHAPKSSDEVVVDMEDADAVDDKMSIFDKTLQGVEVKGKRRRGLKAIDYTKPLCSYDAVELYNLVTDYGLSYGKFNPGSFPEQVSVLLLGNFSVNRTPVVKPLNNYYITYLDGLKRKLSEEERNQLELLKIAGRDNFQGFREEIKLKRLKNINLFSDFELRNEDRPMTNAQDMNIHNTPVYDPVSKEMTTPDVVVDYVTLLNDATRPTFRDRWLILPGIYEPDDFYHPDYTHRTPSADVKDYRRTLYWNPNALLDENGEYHARFYNNGKTTRIKVNAVGVTSSGKPIFNPSSN